MDAEREAVEKEIEELNDLMSENATRSAEGGGDEDPEALEREQEQIIERLNDL